MSTFETGIWFGLGLYDAEISLTKNPGYARIKWSGIGALFFTHTAHPNDPQTLWEPFNTLLMFDAKVGGELVDKVPLNLMWGAPVALHQCDTVTVQVPPMDFGGGGYGGCVDLAEAEDVPMEDRGFGV